MSAIKNNSYIGYLEKSKNTVKKRKMKGGTKKIFISKNNEYLPYFEIRTTKDIQNFRPSNLVFNSNKYFKWENGKNDYSLSNSSKTHTIKNESNLKKRIFFSFRKDITEDFLKKFLEYNKPNILKKLQELGIQDDVVIDLYIPYISNGIEIPEFKKMEYITDYEIKLNHILSSQEYKNNEKYLNVALRAFGIRESLLYFGDFLSNFSVNLPIISVGSGTAYFEYLIQKIFRREIICVDPSPTEYSNFRNPTVFINPKYKTVNGNGKKTLVESSNYNKMKDCLLILNWSNPMFENNSKYNPYDYEAIIKLKPTGFFIVYETFGGSASDHMRYLLNAGPQIESNPELKISDEETISYKLLNNIEKFIGKKIDTVSSFNYRIAYYKKNKVRNESTLFNNNNNFEE